MLFRSIVLRNARPVNFTAAGSVGGVSNPILFEYERVTVTENVLDNNGRPLSSTTACYDLREARAC